MARYDIAVIGGGPAGLMAALAAAEAGKYSGKLSIAVLEKNPRVGKKLLITGNGRCNLTNQKLEMCRYHGDIAEAERVLELLPPQKVVRFFEEKGLLCREEGQGRVYPQSGQASSVLDVLRLHLSRLGVEERCGFPLVSLKKTERFFLVQSSTGETAEAARVILACGGKAAPQTGSSGDGYVLAKSLGHSVNEVFPALLQVKTEPERVKALKGIRCPALVRLLADGKALQEESGEVQFADGCLSGICVFQLSRRVGKWMQDKKTTGRHPAGLLEISLDLLEGRRESEVLSILKRRAALSPPLPLTEFLTGIVNKRLGQELIKRIGLQNAEAGLLRESQLWNLAALLKDFRFPVLGVMPWANAQVTAGGVPLKEIDCTTMASKRSRGLYLAGEVLNVDGDCGGYNLQWAWASGMLAGRACARSLEEDYAKNL